MQKSLKEKQGVIKIRKKFSVKREKESVSGLGRSTQQPSKVILHVYVKYIP